jgi:hypothetical protein
MILKRADIKKLGVSKILIWYLETGVDWTYKEVGFFPRGLSTLV